MARLRKKMTPADKVRKKDQPLDAVEAGDGQEKKSSVAPAAIKEGEKRAKIGPVIVNAPTEPNLVQRAVQFLREVRVELKKVTWPNRKQTAGSTLVVIILVFIIASFLGLVDFGLSKLVQVVLA